MSEKRMITHTSTNKQAGVTLKTSRTRYRRILEAVQDGILILDAVAGQIDDVNPYLINMLGYTKEELLGKKLWEIDALKDKRTGKEIPRQLKDKKYIRYEDLPLVTKDGRELAVELVGNAHMVGGKKVIRCSIHDVTERKRVERKLKMASVYNRSLIETSLDPLVTICPDGKITDVNIATEQVTGHSREGLIGTDFSKYFTDPEKVRAGYRQVFREGMVRDYELEIRHRDGHVIPVLCNASVYRDETGQIVGILVAARDITERKQAEEELRKSKETLQAFFDAVHESMVLIDARGTVLLANMVGARRLGKTVPEITGTCLYDCFPPDIAQCRKEQYEKVIATGKPVYFQDVRAGRYFEQYCYPVYDRGGKATGAAIFVHELTERKKAYEALQKSEQKYRTIFDNSIEGVFQTTPEGRFISVNPAMARMFGYTFPEEMVKDITNIGEQLYINPKERKRYQKIIEEQGRIERFEVQYYRKDRSILWVSINARTVKDEAGKVIYYEGMTEDITERKQTEEDLKQTLEKLRRSLVGTIQVISLMLETRDPYTGGHQKRVSSLARSIAQEMDLSKDMIENIRMAGTIHDIGKISAPAEILSKPTRLTKIEFELIKAHPQTGHDILKDVALPSLIAEIVLQHHERLDGSGYPKGLKGEQILLEAQILAIADVVEAMASHRPYRPAKGVDFALEEIEQNKGILYDAKAVDACVRLFRKKGFRFE